MPFVRFFGITFVACAPFVFAAAAASPAVAQSKTYEGVRIAPPSPSVHTLGLRHEHTRPDSLPSGTHAGTKILRSKTMDRNSYSPPDDSKNGALNDLPGTPQPAPPKLATPGSGPAQIGPRGIPVPTTVRIDTGKIQSPSAKPKSLKAK